MNKKQLILSTLLVLLPSIANAKIHPIYIMQIEHQVDDRILNTNDGIGTAIIVNSTQNTDVQLHEGKEESAEKPSREENE